MSVEKSSIMLRNIFSGQTVATCHRSLNMLWYKHLRDFLTPQLSPKREIDQYLINIQSISFEIRDLYCDRMSGGTRWDWGTSQGDPDIQWLNHNVPFLCKMQLGCSIFISINKPAMALMHLKLWICFLENISVFSKHIQCKIFTVIII